MFSTFHARILEQFCKNTLHFLPAPHHPWRSLRSLSWERDKPWVPRDVEVCGRCGSPELKGKLGLIFWTGAHSHVSGSLQGNETAPLGPTLPSPFAPLSHFNPFVPLLWDPTLFFPPLQKSDYIGFPLNSPQRNDGEGDHWGGRL